MPADLELALRVRADMREALRGIGTLNRSRLELAAGGVKRPFEHWRAVAAPDVKPGPNHFVASVTDGAGFP